MKLYRVDDVPLNTLNVVNKAEIRIDEV